MGSTYHRESKRLYYLQHREEKISQSRAHYAANKAMKLQWQSDYCLSRKYFKGMTPEAARVAYNEILAAQGGVCAICRKPETKKDRQCGKVCDLAVDHDHTTEKVRGLLCFICNTNLGRFEANLDSILAYLGKKVA